MTVHESHHAVPGCIPVFLGPPFAAVPLSQDLAYSDFSLTYNLDSHALWTASEEEVSSLSSNNNTSFIYF